jgi:hypothetical protein
VIGPRRWSPRRYPAAWFSVAAVIALIVAGLPIAFAGFRAASGTVTSLAGAPDGLNAVLIRHGETADTVVLAPLADLTQEEAVADIPHLAGHAVRAAVSPDGRFVAVVAPDRGSLSRPIGTLYRVDLEDGTVATLAGDIDPLSTPLWRPDGGAVIVRSAGDPASGVVELREIPIDGRASQTRARFEGVLGAYPVGFDPAARLHVTLIDGRGSTLVREDGAEWPLARGVTRDWELSPDGSALAFIEDTSTADGRSFQARLVALDGSAVASAATGLDGQQLGIAWRPGAAAPTFGFDPGTATGAAAASTRDGFDIPIAYSPDGAVLAVEAWTGASFAERRDATLAFVTTLGRVPVTGPVRFAGWSAR